MMGKVGSKGGSGQWGHVLKTYISPRRQLWSDNEREEKPATPEISGAFHLNNKCRSAKTQVLHGIFPDDDTSSIHSEFTQCWFIE